MSAVEVVAPDHGDACSNSTPCWVCTAAAMHCVLTEKQGTGYMPSSLDRLRTPRADQHVRCAAHAVARMGARRCSGARSVRPHESRSLRSTCCTARARRGARRAQNPAYASSSPSACFLVLR